MSESEQCLSKESLKPLHFLLNKRSGKGNVLIVLEPPTDNNNMPPSTLLKRILELDRQTFMHSFYCEPKSAKDKLKNIWKQYRQRKLLKWNNDRMLNEDSRLDGSQFVYKMNIMCTCSNICDNYEKYFKEDLARELREGNYLSSRLLMDVCDNLRDLDDEGNTVLHLGLMSGDNQLLEQVCQIVQKKDSGIIHVFNKLGLHSAHLAACDDSTTMMKILQKYFSFDTNVRDMYRGWTPLQYALKYKKQNVAMYLIGLQTPLIYTDDSNKTFFIL